MSVLLALVILIWVAFITAGLFKSINGRKGWVDVALRLVDLLLAATALWVIS